MPLIWQLVFGKFVSQVLLIMLMIFSLSFCLSFINWKTFLKQIMAFFVVVVGNPFFGSTSYCVLIEQMVFPFEICWKFVALRIYLLYKSKYKQMQSSIQLWLRPFRPCNTDKQIKGGLSSFHLVAPTLLIFLFVNPSLAISQLTFLSATTTPSLGCLSVCLRFFFFLLMYFLLRLTDLSFKIRTSESALR